MVFPPYNLLFVEPRDERSFLLQFVIDVTWDWFIMVKFCHAQLPYAQLDN